MAEDRTVLLKLLNATPGDPAVQAAIAEQLARMDFYKLHKRPLVRLGQGIGDARPPMLAHHLKAFSARHGPEAALSALDELVAMHDQTSTTYAYIEEVDCHETIDLGDNVCAMPEEAAPNAEVKRAIAENRGTLSLRRGSFLVARQTLPIFLEAPSDQDLTMLAAKVSSAAPGMDRIDIALRMITLCGPSSPFLRFRSTIIEEMPRLFDNGSGFGISWSWPNGAAPGMPKLISDEARELIAKYKVLSAPDRRRVDIAIHRLAEAVRSYSPGDAIVDLCIGFEAVLSDTGNKDELTYRLRLRLALILEAEIATRQSTKKLLADLYGERSKIVHGAEPDARDVTLREKGELLLTRLLCKVLDLRGVPDWPLVELHGGVPPSSEQRRTAV